MKQLILILAVTCLAACAGNPPDWWNPSGQYSHQQKNAPVAAKPVAIPSARPGMSEIPIEENIEPALEAYEELDLAPLSEEEMDTAYSVGEGEETEKISSQFPAETVPEGAPIQPETLSFPVAEEHLPQDGSLPLPSVLE